MDNINQVEGILIQGWQPAITAPKGDVILAEFDNYPLPVATTWNQAQEQWVVANVQCDMYEGRWNDTYFENQYECAGDLKAWMPLPTKA